MIVVDASVLAALALDDEDDELGKRVLAAIASSGAAAPALLWFELRNILIVAERRGRIAPAETAGFLVRIATLPIRVDTSPAEAVVLAMAREHRLTVYDAAYLELSQRLQAGLATLDRALATAAGKSGVAVFA